MGSVNAIFSADFGLENCAAGNAIALNPQSGFAYV